MSAAPSCVAFVPARSGSTRVRGKNVRVLAGHPLIAYTIAAARDAEVFDAVVVSTNDEAIAEIARHYGAEAPFLRPAAMAGPQSPDIEWVEHALTGLQACGRSFRLFCDSQTNQSVPHRRHDPAGRGPCFAGRTGSTRSGPSSVSASTLEKCG